MDLKFISFSMKITGELVVSNGSSAKTEQMSMLM